jgi:FkbM family methyltransferase
MQKAGFNRFYSKLNKIYGKTWGSYSLAYEAAFAAQVLNEAHRDELTVLDVGANMGDWSNCLASQIGGKFNIYCFEPSNDHRASLSILENKYQDRLHYCPIALSSTCGPKILYKDKPGSGLASVYERDLGCHGIDLKQVEKIASITLDSWMIDNFIKEIDFLKVDVEGHELEVFQGGRVALSSGSISVIQFELGGCNIDSRTYLKDFHNFFVRDCGYSLYRLAPSKCLVDLNSYSESLECFSWQNVVAFRDKSFIPSGFSVIHE